MVKNPEKFEKYKIFYESSSDALMTLEPPEWNFTSGNPAAVRLFGAKDEQEFISLRPWDFSPEKQPDGSLSSDKAKEMIGAALKNGSNFFEWTHKKYQGESFPATVLLTRVKIENKELLLATVRDISLEEEIKKQLAESEEKFRSAFNSSMLGMAMVSPKGRWLKVNAAACRMTGYSEQELLNMDFKQITHPEEAERDFKALKGMLEGKAETYQVEKRYIKKNKEMLWAAIHVTLVRDKDKQPLYFVTEIEDINDRKKSEEELRQKIEELERINNMMVGRELKMKELKEEIEKLKKEKNENQS